MNKDGTLDDLYLEWLYSKLGSVRNRNPARSYWALVKQLYSTPFIYFVPNDDNRAIDGMELRQTFASEVGIHIDDHSWLELPCSMLEMLLALAGRASFESQGTPDWWFWKLVNNIELRKYTDAVYNESVTEWVDEILSTVNERTYGEDGNGGLFPLRHAQLNQRNVELWYQMSAYLLEGRFDVEMPEK